jgi:D-galactarolactone cycloisomerase
MRAMIISRITTHILRAPIPERTFYSSQAAFPERNSLLVKVEADNGLVGWARAASTARPVRSLHASTMCWRRCSFTGAPISR